MAQIGLVCLTYAPASKFVMVASSASFIFVVLACAPPVEGLRAAGKSDVAESIGDAVKNIDRLYASRFNHDGPQGASALGETIAAGLQAEESTLVNPEVSRVVAEGTRLAEAKVVDDAGTCNRNLEASCPSGWLQVGSAHCVAPASYAGGCPRMQSFDGRSLSARVKFADECDAPWPCATDCASGLDFDNCPEGWTDDGDGYCSSDSASTCLSSYKFNAMSISQKEELASVCGFSWPCRGACIENYDAPCPEDWASVGDECVGPRTYAGDCDFSFTTTGMTNAQKQALASSCGVRFPCS